MELNFQNATFICGHRKSGTTLLLCLLDNHPQLLVYPADSAFFYGYYPTYDNRYSDDQKINRIAGFVIDQLEKEINTLSEEDQIDLNLSIDNFRMNLKKIAQNTEKKPHDMLISLLKAYRLIFKGSENAVRWVEKTTSTEIYASEIKKWFPLAKFIHVIRDPRDNWASLKSGWKKRYISFNDSLDRLMQSMIDRGRLGLEFAKYNEKRFGSESYKIIKFEELATNPNRILQEICNFLCIDFSNNLLSPTICGKHWKGNNFDGLTFEKPSSINVGRWKERITDEEARLIEFHFSPLMEFFNYPKAYQVNECMDAATRHYKWYNFAQLYSQPTVTKNG